MDRSPSISEALEAALRPGGALHGELSDLIVALEAIATADAPPDSCGDAAVWSGDHERLIERVGTLIVAEVVAQG